MPLFVKNHTGAPVVLAAGSPVCTVPASAVIDVTSELRGLSAPNFALLEAQRPGVLAYYWGGAPEYSTASLLTSIPGDIPTGSIPDDSFSIEQVLYRGECGNGSDGDLTLGGPVTLLRDMFYNDLAIPAGRVLNTNGFKVFVRGTCTLDGTIQCNGGDASGATAGSAGSAGSLAGGAAGGAGGAGGGGGGGVAGSAGSGVTHSLGASGGAGGAGGGAGVPGAAGAAGAATALAADHGGMSFPSTLVRGQAAGAGGTAFVTGGGGGGGGGGDDAAGAGGGGGGGGGVVILVARRLLIGSTGLIRAAGGAGAAGAAGDAGGGGGGGGGFVGIRAHKALYTTGYAIHAPGGLGGAAAGAGASGVAGTSGTVIQVLG